jgi:hypothetical protein
VFGFRPARNRNDPGDPPPKWAPLGRAGRLILLVTVIVGIVIALLIMTSRTAGAADSADGAASQPEPSAPPWFGGRVEVPEAGFAATFPEGWVVEIVEEDSDTAILVVAGPERFGPDTELRNLLVAWGPGGQDRDTLDICTLVQYQPIELTADEFMDEIWGMDGGLPVESLHEGLSRAHADPGVPFFGNDLFLEQYAIGGNEAIAFHWCTGVESHSDDWRSIAESFEFLPAEE